MLMQGPSGPHWLSAAQTLTALPLHVPVTGQHVSRGGQVGWGLKAVQTTSLERLHDPVASVAGAAPWQSPSQASPSLSLSRFVCVGLSVRTQLSFLSWMPSA